MRSSNIFVAMLAVTAVAFLVGCGGGGQGYRVPDSPLVIESSSLPDAMSGEYIDFDIPISGGCDGPYVVEVIAGTLPPGVGTVDGTVTKLQGWVLEDGIYNFTIKITDTSPECKPFYTLTQAYTWDIQQGPVKIVDAEPGIILNADYDDPQKYGDIDALETVVFSSFVAYNLIAAGGQGPYTCAVIDDPNDPDDGNLPLGVSMAPQSCSIVGTPSQVLAGGIPFRLTIEVTDAVGQKATRKLQWKIDTPPIIISNSSLVDGKAGTSFSDAIQIVDGVPPFAFELTDNAPGDDPTSDNGVNDDITYASPAAPLINSFVEGGLDFLLSTNGLALDNARLVAGGAGRVDYPADNDASTSYRPMPSEGLYFRESGPGAGSFFGTPRRRGTFTMYVHAYSTLVPNERGQHGFKALSHTIDKSEPPVGLNPAFEMNPNFTLETAFSAPGAVPPAVPAATCGTLAEAEVTVVYNPDVNTGHPAPGLKLLGQGGVAQDGYKDSPHEAQRFLDSGEIEGEYNWLYDEITPLPEMGLLAGAPGTFGSYNAAGLVRSAERPIRFTVLDEQLPTQVRDADTTIARDFNISVGPDLVIITESTQSFTGTSTTGSADTNLHDRNMKIRKFAVLGGSGSVANLDATDLCTTSTIPAIANVGTDDLGALLSTSVLDLMRMSINPGGWWDDQGNMNPKAARAHMGVDKNSGRPYYQTNGDNDSGGGWHASVSGADLPNTPGVVHSPATGVYNDGGKMYAFTSSSHFGLFVVRSTSKIYVPFAIEKGTLNIQKFGDGLTGNTADSNFNMVPMSVSPDGRFATLKVVKTTSTSLSTSSQRTQGALILISLTGEKFSGGETYQIIDFAPSGTYMFSTSVVMTDQSIYFLTGNEFGTYASWRDHFIQTYQYRSTGGAVVPAGGTTAVSAALASGVGSGWTQSASTPMQTPFHLWSNATSTINTFLSSISGFGNITVPNSDMYIFDGWNMGENSTAPVPFRVSADGKHCALLAGARSGSTSGTDVMLHHAWVASNSGSFNQASTLARHSPNGAGRGYALRRGPNSYRHWGAFSGPTTAFEIADDGTAIAYTYNRVGSVSSTSTNNWNNAREDLIVVKGNGAATNPFTSASETEVTKDIFGGSIKWRFGSIVFTKDSQGVIFWGGASCRDATGTSSAVGSSNPSPTSSTHFLGTYYAFNLSVANQVRGVMPTSAGGIGTFPTYSSSSKFAPATPTYTTNLGLIKPYGGFISRSRDYFYVSNYHPNSNSDQTGLTLLGINIEDLSAGSTASGHQKGRGFKPSGWPARRGFVPNYYYQPHYGFDYGYFIPHHTQGGGMQAMHKDTGSVFWMSHYSRQNPSKTTSTSSFSSGPAIAMYWYDYGYIGFHMEGFNADVGGPVSRLSHAGLGGDTSNRSGQYFMVSNDGSKIAYGYQTTSSTRFANQDKIGVITNIGFDPNTGAPNADMDNADSNKAFLAEASNGRGGESMAFDSGGTKLYYAFKAGASNENLKSLVELKIDPTTGPGTPASYVPGKRYNVLNSGR